eukprot:2592183-Amphidinium_carterae.1
MTCILFDIPPFQTLKLPTSPTSAKTSARAPSHAGLPGLGFDSSFEACDLLSLRRSRQIARSSASALES